MNPVNILLVDDRPDGLLALEVALRGQDYRFHKAGSGSEALRLLMELGEDFAVILLDVQMPIMDGFETARLIKTQERYRHVPIIFVTGFHGDPRFLTQGYEVGAIDYVTKPYQPYILRSKVAVLVDLFRKNRLVNELQAREHQRELAETRRQLEEEFSVRERRLISLAENSTDFIAVADRNAQITYVNRAGRELVGLASEAESRGKSLGELFSGEDRRKVEEIRLPILAASGQWEEELSLTHFRTGNRIPVWLRAVVIKDPRTGEVDAIATVARDISRQKADERALRESERRFRTVTSFAPVGICYADERGGIEFANQRWREIFGLSEEQTIGDGWLSVVHAEDRERLLLEWKTVTEAVSEGFFQFRIRGLDGEPRWVNTRVLPICDDTGRPEGYIGSALDVTERVNHERELRSAAEALTRSNAELQRFAWIASHDLKEPLRMVASYVRLLEKRYKGRLDERADQYINFAADGARRMYDMMDGILAFSGIDRCAQRVGKVDCNVIFDTAVSSLQVAIAESGATVSRGELPRLTGDSAQIGQLFQNLISNGIKFRGEKAPEVRVEAQKLGHDWEFRFRDNGIGIEPRFAKRIFGVFQRLHTKEQFPGTGVGLAICKKIVEKHGGRIWVESEAGQGATFCFRLPPEERERGDAPPEYEPEPRNPDLPPDLLEDLFASDHV